MDNNWDLIKPLLLDIAEREEITSSTAIIRYEETERALNEDEEKVTQQRETERDERHKTETKTFDAFLAGKEEERLFRNKVLEDMDRQFELKQSFIGVMKDILKVIQNDGSK